MKNNLQTVMDALEAGQRSYRFNQPSISTPFDNAIEALKSHKENVPVGGDAEEKINKIFSERMNVVRMLAVSSGCSYGIGKDDNTDWLDEWRNVVYIDLPQGQVSWHIAADDMHLFEDFPLYKGKWDGTFNGRCPDFAKTVKALQSPSDGWMDIESAQKVKSDE